MADMFVDVSALNFRNAPVVSSGTRIGSVYLGQKLFDLEESDVDGWVSCSAEIDGEQETGFVSAKFLREPLSDARERLVASVHREWMRFERGLGKETKDPYFNYVGEMWNAIGLNLDGKDTGVPWSAAAISFMVRNAGDGYQGFRFAAAHSRFVHQSINARMDDDDSVPFWGYRLHEKRPEIGDIICRGRAGVDVDFDFATEHEAYKSHTDIVMQIDSANNKLLAIGGNVSNSVKITVYDLTLGDFADDTNRTFAILKNIVEE